MGTWHALSHSLTIQSTYGKEGRGKGIFAGVKPGRLHLNQTSKLCWHQIPQEAHKVLSVTVLENGHNLNLIPRKHSEKSELGIVGRLVGLGSSRTSMS